MKNAWHAVGAATVIGLLFSTPLIAKESPPAIAAPRPFAIPAPYVFELPNGLKATFIEFGSVPKVTISASVRVGTLNQGSKRWLPQMTGDFLKEGTRKRTANQIANIAADMGGAISIGVDDDVTNIEIDALTESGIDALQLVAEIVTNPSLPATEFNRIRQDYIRRLSVAKTQAQTLADDAFDKLLYGDHPYGTGLPTEKELAALKIDDIKKFYAANFGAQRTHIYVAGRFDRAIMEQAIRKAFGGWQRGPEALINPPTETGMASSIRVTMIDRPDAEQSTILFGKRVSDPAAANFIQLSVANTVLGGSLTSRITSNLREAKGWAYSPDSSLSTHVSDAYWAQSADVATAHTAESIHEIIAEINKLRSTQASVEELQAVKNYRNGVFVLANATPAGLIGQLAFMDLHHLPGDWLSTYLQRLYAVTPAEVTEAVDRSLDPKKMTLVVVGEMKLVAQQIKSLPELAGAKFVESKP